MNLKKLQFSYCMLHLGYWICYLLMSSYATVLMIYRGMDALRVGYITMISSVLSVISEPLIAQFADRTTRFNLRQILIFIALLDLLCGTLLFLLPDFYPGLFFLMPLMITFTAALSSLFPAFCLEYNAAGVPLNYGFGRGIGSLAFSVGGYAIGLMLQRFTAEVILPVYIIAMLFLLVFLFQMPAPASPAETLRDNGAPTSLPEFFRKYTQFDILLLGIFLLFFMQRVENTFMIYIVRDMGGNEADMGRILFITAFAEIPAIFLGSKLIQRFSARRLMRFMSIFGALKFVLIACTHSILAFTAIHVLHLFFTGMYMCSSVYYVNSIVDPHDTVKAQSILGVTINGVIGIAGNLAGGALIQHVSVSALLLTGAVMAVSGSIVIHLATGRLFEQKSAFTLSTNS